MEISGAVLRRAPVCSGAGLRHDVGASVSHTGMRARISARPSGVSVGFSDDGHVRYYLPPVRCGERKKEEKKRAKLVKGLSKDLSAFYSMGFGIEAGDGVTAEVKGKMMTEAANLLLSQLNQLRAEEKELKKKRKQDKAARMKDDDSSSSSSSESSGSECDTVARPSKTAEIADPKPDIYTTTPIPTAVAVAKPMDKIEVCMGGKCKKSGGMELLDEFERRVGIEGAVSGCKCMGKCRYGPNVRVLNHNNEEDSAMTAMKHLCIGVGLEDVGGIVANFYGARGMFDSSLPELISG